VQTHITKSTNLVAASAVLGGAELVHLSHTLLELLVLALLVRVSLVLNEREKDINQCAIHHVRPMQGKREDRQKRADSG
jgi:hypothetical protein